MGTRYGVAVNARQMSLVETVVAGLTAPMTEDEEQAWRSPPYPTPANLAPIRDRLISELADRVLDGAEDGGPPVATRVQSPVTRLRSEARLAVRRDVFDVADAATVLLAAGAFDEDDIRLLLEHLPSYSGFHLQLVRGEIAGGDLDRARARASTMERPWIGYRAVGAALAEAGDARGFFAEWKHYNSRQDRNGMVDLKRTLVSGVAKRDGWQAALKVVGDKRIGPDFTFYVFDGLPSDDVDGRLRLFAGDAAGVLTETDEVSLLARAVREASGWNPTHDHPALAGILDRILAVGPDDKTTMRWRDGELFRLWPAIGEQATLDRVRKAVRTPNIKRELKVLARNLRPLA